jgi:hypothetical protein
MYRHMFVCNRLRTETCNTRNYQSSRMDSSPGTYKQLELVVVAEEGLVVMAE